jgi:SEC-C motif-containing protein
MTTDAATEAATAATTTHGQTGPRTEAGKAKSSRNAIRTGLYAARDFIRPEEEEEYAQTLIKLMDELTPENTVEQTFATEIMGATWRLRRCRLVEEAFGLIEDLNFDPMMDERTEKQQKSVDRARAQSHLILRRSLDELRKLQKVRTIQEQIADQIPTPKPAPTSDPAPAGMDALMNLAESQLAQRYRESGLDSFCNPASPAASAPTSFCNPTTPAPAVTKNIPRNAPCPCRSGAKYKKCCGGPAPGALKPAA